MDIGISERGRKHRSDEYSVKYWQTEEMGLRVCGRGMGR